MDTETTLPAEPDAEALPAAILSLQLLECLARAGEERGVTELAVDLGLPKPRVYRHLSALRQHGFVAQNPRTSRYGLGWRFVLLGQQARRGSALVSLARPVLEDLRNQVRYTAVLSTPEADYLQVLDWVPGGRTLDVRLRPGTRFPFHSVAQGKVALAFGPPALLENLPATLEATTALTVTDLARLRQDVALVRDRGWADAPEQAMMGINALAVPVQGPDGTLAAVLGLVGSVHYLPAEADPGLIALLQDGARRITATLGAHSPMETTPGTV